MSGESVESAESEELDKYGAVTRELRTIDNSGGPRPDLLDLALGNAEPEELSYEGWVCYLKLSGGRVCLRIERSGSDWYVRRNPAGMLLATVVPNGAWVMSVRVLREILSGDAAREGRVRPVLVEDTPFGSDGP